MMTRFHSLYSQIPARIPASKGRIILIGLGTLFVILPVAAIFLPIPEAPNPPERDTHLHSGDTHGGDTHGDTHFTHGDTHLPSNQNPFDEPPKALRSCAMHPHIQRGEPGLCPICGMELVHTTAPGEHAQHARQAEASLSLTPAERELLRIQTLPTRREFPTLELRLSGKVGYDETRLAHISAWAPGRIEELYVDFTGARVRQGDHMARIYSPQLYAAQEEFIQAGRALRNLAESGMDSLIETAYATRAAAGNKLRQLGMSQANISRISQGAGAEAYVTIDAPIGGVVIGRHASEGMYLDTGTRIFTIADLSHLWVQLDAYESDLEWLRYGQLLEFEAEALPGKSFQGQVVLIDPTLDTRTRTARVRVNIDNSQGLLKPEMFVRARLSVRLAGGSQVLDEHLAGKWISPMHPEVIKDTPGQCDICGMALVPAESLGYLANPVKSRQAPLVVPTSAVMLTGKRALVYVEDRSADTPTYTGREVVLGARAGDVYLVQEGLTEGELVVVSGNFRIDSALQISARPSMMGESAPPPAHRH